jgi:O-antigen/teichoic acid export membrane protein
LKSILLIAGRVSAMGMSFAISMIIARSLGGSEYGRYIFLISIVNWVGLVFTFGLDSVPKMLAAVQEPDHQKKLLGGFFAFTGCMSLLLTLVLWICSIFVDSIFHISIKMTLLWVAPLAGANLFQVLIEWACFGLKKTNILSGILFISRLLNLLVVIFFIQQRITSAAPYYFGFLLSTGIFPIVGWITLQPDFSELKQSLREIQIDLKIFGKDAYIGRVPSNLAYNIDRLLLGYFSTSKQVGFYGLSQSLVNPVVFVGGAVSQVAYRDFSSAKEISRKMMLTTIIVSLLASAATCVFGVLCIIFFLPLEYRGVLPLLFIMSLSALFQSLYAPFNSFLGSKGKGRMLRNLGWTYTVSSLVLYFVSIPLWGVTGAAYASGVINLIWLLQCIWMYLKVKNPTEVTNAP